MNINALKNTKKDIYPGQIYIKGQFLDLIETQDIDINNSLNNISENTKQIRSALNLISSKEKEKYISSSNNSIN